jgi:hypothetical protein
MKLNNLRQLIKEELKRALKESMFEVGEEVLYAGKPYKVISDNGYIIDLASKEGGRATLNYNQAKQKIRKSKDYMNEDESTKDLKDMPLKNMEEGTYKVEYITEYPGEGGPDYSDFTVKSITKDEFAQNTDIPSYSFWKGIAGENENARIYKVTKVTRA